MTFVLDLDARKSSDRTAIATASKRLLDQVMAENALLIRSRAVPRLYESGVHYCKPHTEADGKQRFYTAAEVLAKGSGTCPDLSAWRAAELRVLGDPAIRVLPCRVQRGRCMNHPAVQRLNDGVWVPGCPSAKIYWRPELLHAYHCEVRLPSGDAEDPSRFLGMGSGGIGA